MGRTPSAEKKYPKISEKMTYVTPDQVIEKLIETVPENPDEHERGKFSKLFKS